MMSWIGLLLMLELMMNVTPRRWGLRLPTGTVGPP